VQGAKALGDEGKAKTEQRLVRRDEPMLICNWGRHKHTATQATKPNLTYKSSRAYVAFLLRAAKVKD
jgi:hypothetical protein